MFNILTPEEKITKARASLVLGHPFFGSLCLKLKPVPDANVKLCTTNGLTLRYNPEKIAEMDLAEVIGVLAHCTLHIAFLHHTRRGQRDKKKWNTACDYVLAGMLEEFKLPSDLISAKTEYKGMSAEQIYSLLPDDNDGNNNGEGSGEGSGGGGGGQGEGEGEGEGESEQDNDPGGNGEVDDSPNSTNKGASQSAQYEEEAEWKQAVAQAAHVARQCGKLPSGMERHIEVLLEPVLPWKDILHRFMTEKCNDDFSWARPNRRFIAQGLYLPSRLSEDAMGDMVICIDTSGSIQQKELDEFGAEIQSIHKEVKPKNLYVIYCDAEVNHVDIFTSEEEIYFKLHGGGGTDFRPPFDYLEEHGIHPRALAYLTDGYGPFPENEPGFPCLWVINNENVIPHFGEHLVLEVSK